MSALPAGATRAVPAMDEQVAVDALTALAQDMRLRILRTLVRNGPCGLTPGALAAALQILASTLSFHLKELTRAGLVTQQRVGRHLMYRPALAHMHALLAYLTAHCCAGVDAAGHAHAPPPHPSDGLNC